MISLGTHDPSVGPADLAACRARLKTLTGIVAFSEWDRQLRDEGQWADHTPLAAGEPYLVPGQHRYRMGWHHQSDGKKVFQALKPLGAGVLVQRSAGVIATDAELEGPLDPRFNTSINVHWGGGGATDSASWSAGCQVVAGKGYGNHHGKAIDCSPFAAAGYAGLGAKNAKGVTQNKGAYTMLVSLVSALSGENPDDNVVRFTLLTEDDLAFGDQQVAGSSLALLQQLRTA